MTSAGSPAIASRIGGFTLIELLAVIGIMLSMMALVVPVMNGIKGGGDVTRSAYDISGTIEAARSFAIANNTYTWVGFYEEDVSSLTATNILPPYTGKGRVLIAVVASKDGTTIVDDSTSGSVTLDPAMITQISKLLKIEGVHLMDIGAPPATPPAGLSPDSLDVRSGLPYDATIQGPVTTQNRINSDGSEKTSRPFVAQGYTFYKTIRFNPRGEANINSTYKFRRVAEIGIRPTRGSTVDTVTPNVLAIQFTGASGSVKIYRR